jgi:hypothetical protein
LVCGLRSQWPARVSRRAARAHCIAQPIRLGIEQGVQRLLTVPRTTRSRWLLIRSSSTYLIVRKILYHHLFGGRIDDNVRGVHLVAGDRKK